MNYRNGKIMVFSGFLIYGVTSFISSFLLAASMTSHNMYGGLKVVSLVSGILSAIAMVMILYGLVRMFRENRAVTILLVGGCIVLSCLISLFETLNNYFQIFGWIYESGKRAAAFNTVTYLLSLLFYLTIAFDDFRSRHVIMGMLQILVFLFLAFIAGPIQEWLFRAGLSTFYVYVIGAVMNSVGLFFAAVGCAFSSED